MVSLITYSVAGHTPSSLFFFLFIWSHVPQLTPSCSIPALRSVFYVLWHLYTSSSGVENTQYTVYSVTAIFMSLLWIKVCLYLRSIYVLSQTLQETISRQSQTPKTWAWTDEYRSLPQSLTLSSTSQSHPEGREGNQKTLLTTPLTAG